MISYSPFLPDFREKRLKLGVLINELSTITAEWHAFGIQLGVDHSKLKEFDRYSCDVKRHLTEMLQLWLKQDPPPTIPDLLSALRGPSLNYRRLADKLKRSYNGKHRCSYVYAIFRFVYFQFSIIILDSETVVSLCSKTLNFAVHMLCHAVLVVYSSLFISMILSTMVF